MARSRKTASRSIPSALEADYQKTIVQAAKLHGWYVHAERPALSQSGRWITSVQGKVGFPDLVLVHPKWAKAAFIELKRRPNRATQDQSDWLSALGAALPSATVALLWMPDDLERCLTFLSGGMLG